MTERPSNGTHFLVSGSKKGIHAEAYENLFENGTSPGKTKLKYKKQMSKISSFETPGGVKGREVLHTKKLKRRGNSASAGKFRAKRRKKLPSEINPLDRGRPDRQGPNTWKKRPGL